MHGHAGRGGELGEEGLSGGLEVLVTDKSGKNLSTAVQIISKLLVEIFRFLETSLGFLRW